jgi:putative transposase
VPSLHRRADQTQHQNQYGRQRLPKNKNGRDNVFVERLWKSVKYEEVYLRAYDSVADARANLAKYLTFYNTKRPHTALDGNTPDSAYFKPPQPIPVAA